MASSVKVAPTGSRPLSGYWRESTRPLVSLVFVSPMLLIYEAGVLLLGPQALRNGADVWLRQLLDWLGFGQYFLLPLLTCAALLAWHHTTRQQWRIRTSVFWGMLLESMFFGFLLLVVAKLQWSLLAAAHAGVGASIPAADTALAAHLIGYFGAGIYEELLFRLMLLPATVALIRLFGASRRSSTIGAIALTSIMFSAAHYRLFVQSGYDFDWFSFTFRTLAGVSFSLLFLFRGFGIAAGAHALYDVYVAMSR